METMAVQRSGTGGDQDSVRDVLAGVRSDGRTALSAPEAKRVCDAYGIAVPGEGLATSREEAVSLAQEIGLPVVAKIVSPDILHKTEAKGVLVGLDSPDAVAEGYDTIVANARAYKADADIVGVQIQQMLPGGQEVLVGAVTDASFGPVMTFGIGGVLVEVLRDVTFRLAPTSEDEALEMIDDIQAADVLRGVRGEAGVDRRALAQLISRVSSLVTDFPEITEVDLNPVLATPEGATAVDARIVCTFDRDEAAEHPPRYSREDILAVMNRMMRPKSIAVIGASDAQGKIGNSVMRNLIDGGYTGEIYPVNPKAEEILGRRCYKSIEELPEGIDVAVFAIPAKLVIPSIAQCGDKGIPAAVLIPSGFAETGDTDAQQELVRTAREHGIRFIGPNIYGFYYTPDSLCATFCTPYDVKGPVALVSQSGGIGMAILGFARSSQMGVSAIVGVGNKADIDEDDLLTFFEQDDATQCIALHMEDLKDGRSFVEVARRVSQTKPIVVLKAGATPSGTTAAASHTAALAGDDKVYDDILRQAGVVRAPGLRDMLEYARALPILPTPTGENVVIITGAGGSGVLLSDACDNNGLTLMRPMPDDLDKAFREFIPPFGAAGNPVDITGGEPPETYRNTIALGLSDERIHALILGYWHTIITPPDVFADVVIDVVDEFRAKGISKPIVASLAGDVGVEEASQRLFDHGVVAYPYTTETPVEILGAKYRWARMAGLLGGDGQGRHDGGGGAR